MRGHNLVALALCSLLVCCGTPHEDVTGINWADWKADRNGCQGKRASYILQLTNQKDKLKSRSEMDIVELMGRPDQTELLKRNQKFYTYYFASGPGCAVTDTTGTKLVIRFNAMGLAKEVALE